MPGELNTTLKLFQVLLLFAVVLVLAYFTARLVGRQALVGMRARHLRLIELLPLGRDRSIALVEVAGQVLVLGITGHQVSQLGHIDDPEVKAQLLATPAFESRSPADLGRQLGQWFDRLRGRSAQGQPEPPETAAFDEILAKLQRVGQPTAVADRNADVPEAGVESPSGPPPSLPEVEVAENDPAALRLREALKGLRPEGEGDGRA